MDWSVETELATWSNQDGGSRNTHVPARELHFELESNIKLLGLLVGHGVIFLS